MHDITHKIKFSIIKKKFISFLYLQVYKTRVLKTNFKNLF